MKMRARTWAVAVVVLLTLTLPAPQSVMAATVTVTDCGDSGGPGQLRTLIAAAAAGDTISVPACTMTLTLAAGGELAIGQDLTVAGAGASQTIIDGGAVARAFHVTAGNVTFSGLTVRNGHPAVGSGGGILFEGAGTRTVSDSIVSGNTAPQVGGGIGNESPTSSLTVLRTTVSGNTALIDGGGGGIDTVGPLTVTASTISGNAAPSTGPGPGSAGGIWSSAPSSATSLTITNSTVSGNTAASTIDGVGGVREFGGMTITNSTVSGNTGSGGGGVAGGIRVEGDPVTLENTIVANNTGGPNCFVAAGSITSAGHNLESANTCGFNTALGDLINANPLLGPLQNNGGPTQTLALLPGSPAIDAGANAACPGTDQRGVPRPLDTMTAGVTVCDIGAFEVETLGFIHASLALNTATVRPGTLLQGTVTVSNVGGARPLDVYVAVVLPAAAGPGVGCPSGDAVAFLTAGGATLTCVSSGVQSFAPFLTNVVLPADLVTAISAPVFSLVWPEGAPPGSYLVGLVFTPVSAFRDGRVNPTADITLATAGFSATP